MRFATVFSSVSFPLSVTPINDDDDDNDEDKQFTSNPSYPPHHPRETLATTSPPTLPFSPLTSTTPAPLPTHPSNNLSHLTPTPPLVIEEDSEYNKMHYFFIKLSLILISYTRL